MFIPASRNIISVCKLLTIIYGHYIDYIRLYNFSDDSYFNLLKDDYKLIIDLDDKKNHEYGEYYSKYNPISLEKIKGES